MMRTQKARFLLDHFVGARNDETNNIIWPERSTRLPTKSGQVRTGFNADAVAARRSMPVEHFHCGDICFERACKNRDVAEKKQRQAMQKGQRCKEG